MPSRSLQALARALFLAPPALAAQQPLVQRERAAFARWLLASANSPYAAIALARVGDGIALGPADADVPLAAAGPWRIAEAPGGLILEGRSLRRTLPRYRLTTVGAYSFFPSGERGRTKVTVFGPVHDAHEPVYFEYDSSFVFIGPLLRDDAPEPVRILALDGLEVEATRVGSVLVPDGTAGTRLRVYRVPDPGTEESELTIYFQDATNDAGTYPAGRFVSLIPLPDGRYRLDFNRARNPFCAYSTVYPCPAPWPGNRLQRGIAVGEKYEEKG
ncbi:MAG: DUF1684 domain-containing protein [Gemmatimonadales bacterium]